MRQMKRLRVKKLHTPRLRLKSIRSIRYKDLNIGLKYMLALLVMISLFIFAIWRVNTEINTTNTTVNNLNTLNERSVSVTEMGSLFKEKNVKAVNYAGLRNSAYITRVEYDQIQEDFDSIKSSLVSNLSNSDQQEIFETIEEIDQEFNDVFFDSVIGSVQENDQDQLYSAVTRVNELSGRMTVTLNDLRNTVYEEKQLAAEEVNASFVTIKRLMFISVSIAIAVSLIVLYLTNYKIQKRLKNIIKFSTDISEGKLSSSLIYDNELDEIGVLAQKMIHMRESLYEIINGIKQTSLQLNEQSRMITTNTYNVKSNAGNIQESMTDLNAGVKHQANITMEMSNMMEKWVSETKEANEQGNTVKKDTEEVKVLVNKGKENMEASVNQMNKIDTTVSQAMTSIVSFRSEIRKINGLMKKITEVSDQTNLLAINASIEAARAGEHGRGFSVVANEVKKLANQVNNLSLDITDTIMMINMEAEQVHDSLSVGYENVNEGIVQIEDTNQTFGQIDEFVNKMAASIKVISYTIEDVFNHSHVMSQSIQEIASIAEEQVKSVEATTEESENIVSAINEINNQTIDLDQSSQNTTAMVNQFEV